MYLPLEVIILVHGYLGKRDLKASRLVSKDWSFYASSFLFDRIFISPRKVDLEVFNAITQHPTLSKYIKKLKYDGTRFCPDLSAEEYNKKLWSQLRYKLNIATIQPEILVSNPRLHECLNLLPPELADSDVDKLLVKCSIFKYLVEGYLKYKDLGSYERNCLANGDFYQSLFDGLIQLTGLESVEIHGSWSNWCLKKERIFHTLHVIDGIGSPLFRSWNPFHVYPDSWNWDSSPYMHSEPNGSIEFRLLTCALSQTQKHVRTFTTGRHSSRGIASHVFDTKIGMTPVLLEHTLNAYRGLKKLSLSFAAYCDETPSLLYPDIHGLQALLEAAPMLNHLKLELPEDWGGEPPTLQSYEQVFPQHSEWIYLKFFELGRISVTAKNLQQLLSVQMPNLQMLDVSAMSLVDGTWVEMIEWMSRSLDLSFFAVNDNSWLLNQDGSNFLDPTIKREGMSASTFVGNVMEYVVYGGRHPCLCKDQPDSASLEYLSRLSS